MAVWKRRGLAVGGGVVVALIVGELGLRGLGVSFQDFSQADPARGVALRPGARGWFRREGRQYIVINSAGFRDREHRKLKPPNTVRIAVLGDSFTEAFQVPRDRTFRAVWNARWPVVPHSKGGGSRS